jgi:hypothetical protein
VPLSEHEQRLLEQMERALYATLRGADLRAHHRRRIALGLIGFLVGVALLITGAATSIAVVGVLGFLLMLASAWWVTTGWRARPGPTPVPGTGTPGSARSPAKAKARSAGVMDRLEERLRRRREGDNPN